MDFHIVHRFLIHITTFYTHKFSIPTSITHFLNLTSLFPLLFLLFYFIYLPSHLLNSILTKPTRAPVFITSMQHSMAIYVAADPLTRLTMEMVAHTLCADQTQQLRIDFQVRDHLHANLHKREFLNEWHPEIRQEIIII